MDWVVWHLNVRLAGLTIRLLKTLCRLCSSALTELEDCNCHSCQTEKKR
jgi:hypothetical protein